ncbi:homeodomain-like protein [Tanacetum coccineum]
MLRVFPILITGVASHCLRDEPTGSIKTWEDLKTKFLNKYCPPGRTVKKMEEINKFQKESDETLYQAWERFTELLMKCPQRYLTEMQELDANNVKDPITPKIAHRKKKGKPLKKLTIRNLVDLFKEGDIEKLLQVLEDMDAYRDEGMGDVIFGEPFLREVGINTRRLEGIITLYNGDDEVTYQMVRSHPKFKNHTNEQCNKIPPLLKVSERDEKNGISHVYQKLKGFYKGVLNLRPDYIRDAKMEE